MLDHSIDVSLAACVVIPRPHLDSEFRGNHNQAIASLVGLSGRLNCKVIEQSVPITIESYGRGLKRVPAVGRRLDRGFRQRCDVLLCCVDASYSAAYLHSKGYHALPEHDISLPDVALDLAQSEFAQRMCDMIGLANLAWPGSLELEAVLVWNRSYWYQPVNVAVDAYLLRQAVLLSRKRHWPAIEHLDFDVVWTWAQQHSGFLYGFSDSSTSRALNALMHVLSKRMRDEIVELVWAMVGVEALFSRGRDSVMEQLREACKLVLGSGAPRRLFNSAYEFRSAFMHGRENFAGPHVLYDGSPEFEQFDDSLYETTQFLVAILVAAVQQLALRGWAGYDFELIVKDAGLADANGGQ